MHRQTRAVYIKSCQFLPGFEIRCTPNNDHDHDETFYDRECTVNQVNIKSSRRPV